MAYSSWEERTPGADELTRHRLKFSFLLLRRLCLLWKLLQQPTAHQENRGAQQGEWKSTLVPLRTCCQSFCKALYWMFHVLCCAVCFDCQPQCSQLSVSQVLYSVFSTHISSCFCAQCSRFPFSWEQHRTKSAFLTQSSPVCLAFIKMMMAKLFLMLICRQRMGTWRPKWCVSTDAETSPPHSSP